MSAMPGDNRARDAYDDWCAQMGGAGPDGLPLPRWGELSEKEQRAWETAAENAGLAAARAADRMNRASAGVQGWPASAGPPVELRAGTG
jgi:hypothetical protein